MKFLAMALPQTKYGTERLKQAAAENSRGRCGREVARQFVPDMGSGHRESAVVDRIFSSSGRSHNSITTTLANCF